jgi:hypothetical protein
VNGESGVVRLDDGVGNLGRRDDGKGGHHAVGELLANLGNEERAHSRSGSSSERVRELELLFDTERVSVQEVAALERIEMYTLEAVGSLSLLANDIEDGVDELGSLGVVL